MNVLSFRWSTHSSAEVAVIHVRRFTERGRLLEPACCVLRDAALRDAQDRSQDEANRFCHIGGQAGGGSVYAHPGVLTARHGRRRT
jgi:hypothetical protein